MDKRPSMSIKNALKYVIANCNLQLENDSDMAIPYLIGSPGIGKSKFLRNECERLNYGFLSFHLSLIPIEEIGGLPVYKTIEFNGKDVTGTEWSLPDIITKIYEISKKHAKNIVILDDFHISSPAHLALGYELFTERKLRDFVIPDNVAFVLAGNDSSKSGAKQMFGAIMNRLAVWKVEPDFDQWVADFAINSGVNKKIISFLSNQVNRAFFLEEEDTNLPWASPRSWTRFSKMLNSMEKYIKNLPSSDIFYIAYGHVGPSAAAEFIAYYDIYSKTEMDKVFDGGEIKIPSGNNDVYIYGIAAANEYVNRICDESNKYKTKKDDAVDIITKIIVGIGKSNAEISVSILKTILDYAKALGTNKKFYISEILKNIKLTSPEVDSKISKALSDIISALN